MTTMATEAAATKIAWNKSSKVLGWAINVAIEGGGGQKGAGNFSIRSPQVRPANFPLADGEESHGTD